LRAKKTSPHKRTFDELQMSLMKRNMYPWNEEEEKTGSTRKDIYHATTSNTPTFSSHSILMTRRPSNPTTIWKRPQIGVQPDNTNNIKRRRTSYIIRMEDMNTVSTTNNTRTDPIEFSTYLSSSSSLSYSSSFSSIVPCTNSPNYQENDDMTLNRSNDNNNQTLSKDKITTDTQPKCWWNSKSTMSANIMTATATQMKMESDPLNAVSCCCVCRNVLLTCTDTTCNTNLTMPTSKATRTLWNYWKQESNCQSNTKIQGLPTPPPPVSSSSPSSLWELDVSTRTNRRPLQCTYCDRPVCSSCCQSCCECQDLVCSNCSRLDYENDEERMLCGKCYDSCVTMEPKNFQETEDMDWDL
jgi:hypothetical protein